MQLHVSHPTMTRQRAPGACRTRRLGFERLESRTMLTWAGNPPSTIPVPSNPTVFALDTDGDTSVRDAIVVGQTDYFAVKPSVSGSYSIKTRSSSATLDTEMAVFSSQGRLLAYNNDLSSTDADSLLRLRLTAGTTYYVGITNYRSHLGGGYHLRIIGPPQVANPPTPPTTPRPPQSPGQFSISLEISGMTASQRAIFTAAANRWEEIIIGDLPDATYRGQRVDDVLIRASARRIDGVNGILGQAGPDAFRQGSFLPYHGEMQFDSADLASMERSGLLESVVLHEMGHVLGIGTLWTSKRLLSGARTSNPVFTGRRATAAYNELFNTRASGVPVENTGGAGTRDSHWRESIFTRELMTGWTGPGTNMPISTITVGSLADIGYTVNMAAADPFTPSRSARSFATASAPSSRFAGLLAESIFFVETAPSHNHAPQRPHARLIDEAASSIVEMVGPLDPPAPSAPRVSTDDVDSVFARWSEDSDQDTTGDGTATILPPGLELLLRDRAVA